MQQINGIELNHLFTQGYLNLKKNMDLINDLNVFPVPDGDTGTNMIHTFGGGLKAANKQEHVGEYMQSLAKAVLLSARGNSGVIFSQFVHGLYRGFEDKAVISFADFTPAFACATEDAYRSIISPTEGTILTVIREASTFLENNSFDNFTNGFSALLNNMQQTLAHTPELLPVLAEAGVVDSGGAGLVCFFEGILSALLGESIEETADLSELLAAPSQAINTSFGPDSKLEYGYCTEFILQLLHAKTDISTFSRDEFVKPLEKMGDSIVAVVQGDIVKIHIHTFTPEKVLEYARSFGEFVTIKIENMSVQHSESVAKAKKEHYKYAIVAVAQGEGIIDYFYSIGATVVINGGQTNNPSVEAFLDAFNLFDAEHIIVLPNNSNIILTANQAADMYNGANVHIIPTTSIVEGYSALSMMNLWCDTVDELIQDMTSGLSQVISASVTTATRNVELNGVAVEKDKYIGIAKKEILVCDSDKVAVATELIKKITDEVEKDVIIVFYGKNVSPSEVDALTQILEERYPLADVGFVDGKQDVYDFIISLE